MGMLEEVRGLRVDFEDVVIAEEVQVESPSHTSKCIPTNYGGPAWRRGVSSRWRATRYVMVCGRCPDGLHADRPTGAANASRRLARGKGVVGGCYTFDSAGEPARHALHGGGQVLSVDATPRATGMTLLGPAVSPQWFGFRDDRAHFSCRDRGRTSRRSLPTS